MAYEYETGVDGSLVLPDLLQGQIKSVVTNDRECQVQLNSGVAIPFSQSEGSIFSSGRWEGVDVRITPLDCYVGERPFEEHVVDPEYRRVTMFRDGKQVAVRYADSNGIILD